MPKADNCVAFRADNELLVNDDQIFRKMRCTEKASHFIDARCKITGIDTKRERTENLLRDTGTAGSAKFIDDHEAQLHVRRG